ncbi:uncharacterized protein [Palaemon carinicauda]|uniref:uncharacterized protein n=1 Tax=Palaemon carinicauda TaxID=392227 RepID=UPI0035B5CDB3
MVPGPRVIPLDLPESSGSSSGSIRHGIKLQTTMLFSPQPGPSGLCHGRHVHRLEYLAGDLPVSSYKHADESSGQTQDFQRTDYSSSSQLAKKQLVSSWRNRDSVLGGPQPEVNANSTNSQCVSFLKNSECPNFMDFMKFAAQKDADIDPLNTLFLESDKRDSPLLQYDSAVKKLEKFLKDSDVQTMTANLAVTFFRTLFEGGLAASTITTIKSALKKISQFGFNIDLRDSYFSSIPKACARLKPATRPHVVSWFLNDVLKLASDTDNDSCSCITILRKTLFLVSLASGARISELSALSREPGHIDFLSSGEVLLFPD